MVVNLSPAQRWLWDQYQSTKATQWSLGVGLSFIPFESSDQKDVCRRSWMNLVSGSPLLTASVSLDGSSFLLNGSLERSWSSSRVSTYGVETALEVFRSEGAPDVSEPLCRAHWLEYGEGRFALLVLTHPLVCGADSQVSVVRFLAGLDAVCPIFRAPLDAWDATEDHYWRSRLGQGIEALEVPLDLARPSHGGFVPGRVGGPVAVDQIRGIEELSRQHRVSPAAILLTAWTAYLQRLSGQTDIVVGVPPRITSNERTGLPGPQLRMPFRVQFADQTDWIRLAQDIERLWDADSEHGEADLSRIVELCGIEKDPSRPTLIPALFQDLTVSTSSLAERKVELTFPALAASFDLALALHSAGGVWAIEISYNQNLFAEETIVCWRNGYLAMLGGLLSRDPIPLRELPVLAPDDRLALLEQWGSGRQVPVPDVSALELFEQQVLRTPGAVAVRFGSSVLTYRELDQRANFLGAELVTMGVQADDFVGVCVTRSDQMLAALLAVWKAGAAYVPLDPDFPPQRLAYIRSDARLKVLITEQSLADVFTDADLMRLWLDSMPGRRESSPERRPVSESLAYVLHTSGSTGNPKGVQVRHGNLVNFLQSMQNDLGFTAKDVVIAVTTLSFDIAGLELFLPIVSGASVVVSPRETALDGKKLSELMEAESVSLLQATPATWQLLVSANWKGPSGFKGLCGGEAFPKELARELLERTTSLWNVYGPTETTIWSTLDRVESISKPISIGRPIDNTVTYLVDSTMQLVPIGASGELLIGGAGVGKGYLNLPEMTAGRFVSDPFRPQPGAMVYKTGDVCRYGRDGKIYFQRRNDSQVKVRGYRIELGEIETALGNQPFVQQAVAMVRNFAQGDDRLVAYVVATKNASLDPVGLRSQLGKDLPSYMVPQHIVLLESWPMTPNGKIDRKVLPLPERKAVADQVRVTPSNPTEARLWELWRELLQIESFSTQESFFDLGGHSLLAARLAGRIGSEWGIDVPMRTIFQNPTIQGLAENLTRRSGHKPPALAVTPDAEQREATVRMAAETGFPLTASQERNFFAASRGPGISIAVRLQGALDPSVLEKVLQRIVERHEPLRYRFGSSDQGTLNLIQDKIQTRLEREELGSHDSEEPSPETVSRITSRSTLGFDLANGPLYRFFLYSWAKESHLLLASFSQVVFDGGSEDVFLRELASGYLDALSDRPILGQSLTTTYRHFIESRKDRLATLGDSQLSWWRQQLGNEVQGAVIPVDFPRPETPSYTGKEHSFVFPVEISEGVKLVAKRGGATGPMVYLAALFVALRRLAESADVWVAFPVTGRVRPEDGQLIGTFANMLLLRSAPELHSTFPGHLSVIRDLMIDAYDHQDLPLDGLGLKVRSSDPSARVPLYQIEFNYEIDEDLRLEGLPFEISSRGVFNGTSANELTLVLRDSGDRVTGSWEYKDALFEPETIEHWHRFYSEVLALILTQPEKTLEAIQNEATESVLLAKPLSNSTQVPSWWPKASQAAFSSSRVVDAAGRPVPRSVWGRVELGSGLFIDDVRLRASGGWEKRQRRTEVRKTTEKLRVRVLDAVEFRVIELFEKGLGSSGLGLHDNFFDHGGHSSLAVQILNGVNRAFRVQLPLGVLFLAPTPYALSIVIRREARLPDPETGLVDGQTQAASSSIVPIHPEGDLPPLFVAAGAGGNPMNLRHLSKFLGQDQPFYGLQHRGTDGRRPPHRRIEGMVQEYLIDIRALQPQGPYFLGGFSAGGLAIYEVARELIDQGETVALVVMLDSESPLAQNGLAETGGSGHGPKSTAPLGRILARLVASALNRVLATLQRFGLRAGLFFSRFAPYLLRNQAVEGAWLEAERNYVPRPLRVDVLVLRSRDRSMSTQDPTNGWDSLVTGQLIVEETEGDHLTSIEPPHVEALAAVLRKRLEQARQKAGAEVIP